jgi:hypothetical protein
MVENGVKYSKVKAREKGKKTPKSIRNPNRSVNETQLGIFQDKSNPLMTPLEDNILCIDTFKICTIASR